MALVLETPLGPRDERSHLEQAHTGSAADEDVPGTRTATAA